MQPLGGPTGRNRLIGYADESIRAQFIMTLVLVPAAARGDVEREVRSLMLPGQRRLHMNSERPARKRLILSATSRLSVDASIFIAQRPVETARSACLHAIATHAVEVGVAELILDRSEEKQDARDRAALRQVLAKEPMTYRHAASHEHAGLQLADVFGWGYGAGGEWRRRVDPVVRQVVRLER